MGGPRCIISFGKIHLRSSWNIITLKGQELMLFVGIGGGVVAILIVVFWCYGCRKPVCDR